MKKLLFLFFLMLQFISYAQDSVRVVEPLQTSEENHDLLIIAIIGLIVLIGMYFLFRRTRRGR